MKCILLLLLTFSYGFTCTLKEMKADFARYSQESKELAGETWEFRKRVRLFSEVYKDSNENLMFPLVAGYGAAWADDFLIKVDFGLIVASLLGASEDLFYKKVDTLSEGLKIINREVFKDFRTKYFLISENKNCKKELIKVGLPKEFVNAVLLSLGKSSLDKKKKMQVFETILRHEQKTVVAPLIKKLEKKLNLSFLEEHLLLRPTVRFAYFPEGESFKFKNFFNTEERIYWALKSARFALEVSSDELVKALLNK